MKMLSLLVCAALPLLAAEPAPGGPLDPRGQIHIPIGVANTLDTLKTFVEAEGNFSPGFGSYGIYFWVWDPQTQKLTAPTMEGVPCEHGLSGAGWLIPWSKWRAGNVEVTTEVCEVKRALGTNQVFVVGARVSLVNRGDAARPVTLYVAVRPLGPAGWAVRQIGFNQVGDTLAVEGFPAVVATQKPSRVGALPTDTIGALAARGEMPPERYPTSPSGDCSGALAYDLTLKPGETNTLGFVCPVLPHRRAVGHQWDGKSSWAQFDEARPNPPDGGTLQPYAGLAYYRRLKADQLFAEAAAYWKDLAGRATLTLPDPRWAESFAAIVGHSALCLNEGAPDVAVVNYNVFNRDGVYIANILQKAGQFELAEQAIDYFLGHPFNGRVQPEADNPGQILWIMGEHWKFTRSRPWLQRVYPAAQKIVAMIRYCRTTPGPHWVWDTSLECGDALPADKRKELKPGACDGVHPEYTEAFDVAGLRGAITLAEAMGRSEDAAAWKRLAEEFFATYDRRFGAELAKGYGSYSVLWPCRLYPLNEGKARGQFIIKGAQPPASWRYFPLATAHQGLLAGNRAAACETLAVHLPHEQMQGWYAFDEGGPSGVGGWNHVRTTWKQGKESVAMPHGWAIAEFFLLLRDSLVFEDGNRLVLLAGIPPEWFKQPAGMKLANLPTHFGTCALEYAPAGNGARLTLSGAAPPEGFALRLPPELRATVKSDGQARTRGDDGEVLLPRDARVVEIAFDR